MTRSPERRPTRRRVLGAAGVASLAAPFVGTRQAVAEASGTAAAERALGRSLKPNERVVAPGVIEMTSPCSGEIYLRHFDGTEA